MSKIITEIDPDMIREMFEEENKKAMSRTRSGEHDAEYKEAITRVLDALKDDTLLLDTFINLQNRLMKLDDKGKTALKTSVKGFLKKNPGNLSIKSGKKNNPYEDGKYLWIIRRVEEED
jgi:hypothetical protein